MRHYQEILIKLINKHCPNPTTGAEIGVHRGKLSKILLKTFPDLRLCLVDPYCAWPPGSRYYENHGDLGKQTEAEWLAIMGEAIRNVREVAPGRFTMSIMTSAEAVHYHLDKSLDFVFIDGDHTYEGVKEDIALWLPKTRYLLAGHDYDADDERFGVRKAVREVLGRKNLIIHKQARIWAYLVPKPEGEPNANCDYYTSEDGIATPAGQAITDGE
jgi:hypothetical protein